MVAILRISADLDTEKANEQHYEVSSGFFEKCLGPRLKYSCCLYPTGRESLDEAEIAMLESYVDKAGLIDGMEILDLGCGWGSLSLFLAEVLFPLEDLLMRNSLVRRLRVFRIVIRRKRLLMDGLRRRD